MRLGTSLAMLMLVACTTATPADHPNETETSAGTSTLAVWLVSDSGLLTPNLDDVNCHVPDLQVTVADENGSVIHTTDRNGVRGRVSQDPYECRARTVISGVPAAGFYQVTVSGGADGSATVATDDAQDGVTVTLQ